MIEWNNYRPSIYLKSWSRSWKRRYSRSRRWRIMLGVRRRYCRGMMRFCVPKCQPRDYLSFGRLLSRNMIGSLNGWQLRRRHMRRNWRHWSLKWSNLRQKWGKMSRNKLLRISLTVQKSTPSSTKTLTWIIKRKKQNYSSSYSQRQINLNLIWNVTEQTSTPSPRR